MRRILETPNYRVSVVPELELGDFMKPESAAKRNLADVLCVILKSFEAKTKIVVTGIEINRNDQEIKSVVIK